MLALAICWWFAAWIPWQLFIYAHDGATPAPDSWRNLLFLPVYLFYAWALLLLLHAREREGASVLEAAIIGAALAMVSWAVLLVRYAEDTEVPSTVKLTQIGFSLADVVLLALLLRLLASPARWTRVHHLLMAGTLAYLASYAVWNWSTQLGDYVPGSWADLGWLLFPLFLGAAALHPAMRSAFDTVESAPEPGTMRASRLALLLAAVLVAPAIVSSEALTRDDVPMQMLFVGGAAAVVGILVISRLAIDLRERRRLTKELARQNEELLALDRLKDDFVASVSHELRTPLTSIRGYLELVREGEAGELTPEQDEFLAIVGRNADRLLRVVGDLLFVAQAGDGRLELALEDVDIQELVDQATEVARPQAESKEVALASEVGDVPAVRGDRARLGQVLDNLISNAIKFTPAGGDVRVTALAEGGSVVLEVSDSGLGISDDEKEQLFARFYRAPTATEHAIQGTGLGLTIVKAIVEAHRGTIHVTSSRGRGSTFRVAIPIEAQA